MKALLWGGTRSPSFVQKQLGGGDWGSRAPAEGLLTWEGGDQLALSVGWGTHPLQPEVAHASQGFPQQLSCTNHQDDDYL